jgi:hypothetical protein
MPVLALLLRGVFSLGSLLIVLAGVVHAWQAGAPLLAVAAFVAFPVTFFVYPWIGGLEVVFVVSMLAFIASNFLTPSR